MVPYEVVVVVYRSRSQLEGLLEGLPSGLPLVIVDNSYGEEQIADLLEGRGGAFHVDSGGNRGFSAAANLGAQTAGAPYLIFLNPDTRPDSSTLEALVEVVASDPRIAAAGPVFSGARSAGGGFELSFWRVLAHALGVGRLLPSLGVFHYPSSESPVEVDWLSGGCLAVRRDAFLEVGGFDERYFIYMSDIDLGRKLRRRGWRLVLRPDLSVPHDHGGSSDQLPARFTWEMRGHGWAQYLDANHGRLAGALSVWALWLGFQLRRIGCLMIGKRLRAEEMATYARAVLEEHRSRSGRPQLGAPGNS